MASYEEQLETFGKMIDEEEEKKKRGRSRSKINTSSSSGGVPTTLGGSSGNATSVGSTTGTTGGASAAPQTFKAQPQVRVVGFQVGSTTAPSSTAPVAIPSSAGEGRPGRGKRSADGSPSPTTSSLSHSLEGLKDYKSQLDGWSEGGAAQPGEKRTPPFSSSPGIDQSPRKPTSPVGVPTVTKLSSSIEGKPIVSPTRHSPYHPFQPLVSPSASKPMTSPLHHPSSSPSSSTAISGGSAKPVSKAPLPQKSTPVSEKDDDADESDEEPQSQPAGPSTSKKPLTRAERRAIQEAQRAAKQARLAAQKTGQPTKGGKTTAASAPGIPPTNAALGPGGRKASAGAASAVPPVVSKVKQYDDPKLKAQSAKQPAAEEGKKQVDLFSHLPQFEKRTTHSMKIGFSPNEKIHPTVVNLGLKYAGGTVSGSNSRCVAMLTAFKKVIRDFQTPPGTALYRTLEPHLKPQIQFLTACRPHSISMGNAINYVKREIPKTQGMSDEEAKEFLLRRIDTFIEERIILADQAIAAYGVSKINDGDVLLTYAASHPIECMLKLAHAEGKQFRVILVESAPKREAKTLMQKLVKEGIHCTLVLLNAVSYVMKEVTKVFLGAATLLVNGHLMSRAGTAMVAMVANAYNIPVIVCCETYKFCERVQIDSICFNELGDPEELITAQGTAAARSECLKDWRENENLNLLNLVYDVTPSTFITMVITEVGMLPPSSVPVILREYPLQSMEQTQ